VEEIIGRITTRAMIKGVITEMHQVLVYNF
jgi:hypothetical protein